MQISFLIRFLQLLRDKLLGHACIMHIQITSSILDASVIMIFRFNIVPSASMQCNNIPGNEGRYGGKDILASQISIFVEEVKRNEEAHDKFQEQSRGRHFLVLSVSKREMILINKSTNKSATIH